MARKNKNGIAPQPKAEETTPTPTPETPAVPKAKTPKEPRFAPLTAEQAEAALAVARPAVSTCLCGCGGATKGRFVPGHDALHKERLQATIDRADAEVAEVARQAMAKFEWPIREPKIATPTEEPAAEEAKAA